MAQVITVAQQKGGAGKTMLAANLAAHWAGQGRRVGVLDIDPQRSLARWFGLRAAQAGLASLAVSDVSGWRLGRELERLAAQSDVVVIDTPPQIDSDARRAIRQASLVLVPLQPSAPDLWAAEATLALAASERHPVAMVFNRSPARSRQRDEMAAAIASRPVRLLPAALGSRAAYAAAFARGMGVAEAAPRSLAAREFAALAACVEAVIEESRE